MSEPFAVGHLVRLKSGGPRMTVTDVAPGFVLADWFAGPERRSGRFPVAALEGAFSGPPDPPGLIAVSPFVLRAMTDGELATLLAGCREVIADRAAGKARRPAPERERKALDQLNRAMDGLLDTLADQAATKVIRGNQTGPVVMPEES